MNHHKVKHRKFGRRTKHRTSLFLNLMKSLIIHESIKTTLPKAKEIRPMLEKLITKARSKDLHTFRGLVAKMRGDKGVVKKLVDLAERSGERPGGYLRIVKNGYRSGDAAPMAIIQFVD